MLPALRRWSNSDMFNHLGTMDEEPSEHSCEPDELFGFRPESVHALRFWPGTVSDHDIESVRDFPAGSVFRSALSAPPQGASQGSAPAPLKRLKQSAMKPEVVPFCSALVGSFLSALDTLRPDPDSSDGYGSSVSRASASVGSPSAPG